MERNEHVPSLFRIPHRNGSFRSQSSSVPILASLAALLLALCSFLVYIYFSGGIPSLDIMHQVPEGYVGVYWRGGALLKSISGPGFHFKLASLTKYECIQVTIQTDKVINIPCGTKGGVMTYFEKVEVLIAIEKQKVVQKEAETQRLMAVQEAEKHAQVHRILMEQKVMEIESMKRQQEIENEMHLAREKSLADSKYYRIMKEAEANKLMLTPEYLDLRFIEAITNNTKIFFGDKVPSMVLDQRLFGNYERGDLSREKQTI